MKYGEIQFGLPKGKIEYKEDLLFCAAREASESTVTLNMSIILLYSLDQRRNRFRCSMDLSANPEDKTNQKESI